MRSIRPIARVNKKWLMSLSKTGVIFGGEPGIGFAAA